MRAFLSNVKSSETSIIIHKRLPKQKRSMDSTPALLIDAFLSGQTLRSIALYSAIKAASSFMSDVNTYLFMTNFNQHKQLNGGGYLLSYPARKLFYPILQPD